MKFDMMKALAGISGARVGRVVRTIGLMTAGLCVIAGATSADAQAVPTATGKLGPAAPVTYANKWEIYGGLNLMTFQAGQALPKRMNLGGGEILGTYWITKHIGLAADYRGEAGTTPVLANPYTTRPLVYMNMGMLGAQYRGPKNQHAALNFHAYGGAAKGVFNSTTSNIPAQYNNVGLYANKTAPIFAVGASVDLNRSKHWAIRLSPDMIIEKFGTETREFFAISGGVVYRFGSK
ncbi:hypothetical protein BH10ACI4_BH10ACI4_01310 [soil metagenome]